MRKAGTEGVSEYLVETVNVYLSRASQQSSRSSSHAKLQHSRSLYLMIARLSLHYFDQIHLNIYNINIHNSAQ